MSKSMLLIITIVITLLTGCAKSINSTEFFAKTEITEYLLSAEFITSISEEDLSEDYVVFDDVSDISS